MSTGDKFCLRWNDYESNISSAFRDIQDFHDITLVSEEDQSIKAHKVILSACSPFFHRVLSKNPHQHPMLYLKGVSSQDLQAVLDFCYNGQVNVAQEDLNQFLAVAEDLKVKGLTSRDKGGNLNQDNSEAQQRQKPPLHPEKPKARLTPSKPRLPTPNPNPMFASGPVDDDDITEIPAVKAEPGSSAEAASNASDSSYNQVIAADPFDDGGYDDYQMDPQFAQYDESGQMMEDPANKDFFDLLDSRIESMMARAEGKQWFCAVCGKSSVDKAKISKHIEANHITGHPGNKCDLCDTVSKTRDALKQHKLAKHRLSSFSSQPQK